MIYLAFALFVCDLLLAYALLVERQKHHLTRAALRYWRKYSIMPGPQKEQMP